MDTALAIESLVGFGVEYEGSTEFNTEAEFNALKWKDKREKPKWIDLVAKWKEIKDIPKPKTEIELLQEKVNKLEVRITELEGRLI